jgi:hypothetical protein
MDTTIISPEMREKLTYPLPPEAVTPHPTKKFLSSIKSIYVTERLNEVFGTGAWKIETNFVDKDNKMIVVKVKFSIPEYGIEYECFGGNDNPDLGDAYKGATTDALTKIASWLGIGQEVFKGEAGKSKPQPKPQPTINRKPLTMDHLMDEQLLNKITAWVHNQASNGTKAEDIINTYYICDADTLSKFLSIYQLQYA